MSNQQELIDTFKRLTPIGSGLDRDQILFAAGVASVRSGYFWKCLVLLLLGSQMLTLWLLWPSSPRASNSVMPTVDSQKLYEPSSQDRPSIMEPNTVAWFRQDSQRLENSTINDVLSRSNESEVYRAWTRNID